MSGYVSAPCDACAEESVIRRGTSPCCRMTPGCAGHHREPLPDGIRARHEPDHRADDATTARLAARAQTPGRLSAGRARVLQALHDLGASTDHAVAAYAEMHAGSAAKRRLECERLGLVEEHGRSLSPSGQPATTWRLTTQGFAALDHLRRGATTT